jgi:lipopolysaccharide/colanic/teichoic acid biosynthesis glycosyltransferase
VYKETVVDWDDMIEREGAGRSYLTAKRLLDLAASMALLAIFSPVLLACAIAIRLDSEGPIFFRQSRLGRYGRVFRIFKFRTMIPNAAASGDGLLTRSNDPRITRVGAILRRYRLDEAPQLINVFLGEMSLVGPRPLLPEFLPYYSDTDLIRLLVPPGMTGWQQIRGGSRDSWDERISHDVWYVEHIGLGLDLAVLIQTPFVVLRGNSVYGADGWQRSGVPTRCHLADYTIPTIPSQEEQPH